jgi:capsular polysaccharide biosynthesis protein
MEEEIDLGEQLDTLIRGWRVIVGAVAICLVIVLGASLITRLLPRTYQAQFLVAAIRSTTQVSFDTQIRTVQESELGQADRRLRLTSFVQIASSPAIAQGVIKALGEQLPVEVRDASRLLRMIKAEVVPDSDSIAVTVSYPDSQMALQIASAWSEEYVRQVNSIYGGAETETLGRIQQEARLASGAYEREQAAYTQLLSESRGAELQRRVDEAEARLQALSSVKNTATSMWLSQARAQIGDTRIVRLSERDSVMDWILADLRRVDGWLASAEALRAQVELGGASAAQSALPALTWLKVQAFAGDTQAKGATLQLDLATPDRPISSTEMIADVKGLVDALQARRQALVQELAAVSEALSNPESWDLGSLQALAAESHGISADAELEQAIDATEKEIRALSVQLEAEQNRLIRVRGARDLAWETHSTLARKEKELAIAAETIGVHVRLAVPPVILTAQRSSLVKSASVAGAGGLVLGVILLYALKFWQDYQLRTEPAPTMAGPVDTEAEQAAP